MDEPFSNTVRLKTRKTEISKKFWMSFPGFANKGSNLFTGHNYLELNLVNSHWTTNQIKSLSSWNPDGNLCHNGRSTFIPKVTPSIGWQFPIESPRLILLTLKTERFQDFSICHVKQECPGFYLFYLFLFFPHLRTILKIYSTKRVHTRTSLYRGPKISTKN